MQRFLSDGARVAIVDLDVEVGWSWRRIMACHFCLQRGAKKMKDLEDAGLAKNAR